MFENMTVGKGIGYGLIAIIGIGVVTILLSWGFG